MTTGRRRQLTGATGEFRVAAELCRRGLVATPFSGNVKDYDIVASGQTAGHVAVQVKTINKGSWQLDAKRFVEIDFEETPKGLRQSVGPALGAPVEGLMFVMVLLDEDGQDRFFVLSHTDLAKAVSDHHRRYLAKHAGVRPKNAKSTHVSISPAQIADHEGQWVALLSALDE